MATVKMINIADKVSIYSKYLTKESLFTNNDRMVNENAGEQNEEQVYCPGEFVW